MSSPYVCHNCRWSPRYGLNYLRSTRSFSSSRSRHQTLKPATAPKPSPDVKHIRSNVQRYAQNCVERNYAGHAEYPSTILSLSEEARRLDYDLKTPRSRLKQLEKANRKAVRCDTTRSREQRNTSFCLHRRNPPFGLIPPEPLLPETPIGDDPRLVHYLNFDPQAPPEWTHQSPKELQARSHVTIGTALGLIDFTSSATTTGWGWYYLINEGAMLEQALVQYALSVARRRGWKFVAPPSIVYSYIAEACGFQPRDQNNEKQIWSIEQSDRDQDIKAPRSLTGTAEIPLAAMYAGRDIDATSLPLKLVGASRCYRAEAGSRGVDTKGLYRVHEFTKVELFGWADNLDPSSPAHAKNPTSDALFAELLDIQIEILSALHLPCRVLEMPSTDLGASATRKRDIEALFPSRFRPQNPGASSIDPAAQHVESAWGGGHLCLDLHGLPESTAGNSSSGRGSQGLEIPSYGERDRDGGAACFSGDSGKRMGS
ncbi:hypothetical protein N7470_002055 [Penicillium chermesinum]|nr:hypothetical protein N7470_002055 [Penicillium chermesinum]